MTSERVARILDEYGVDGIYNDAGYAQRSLSDRTVSKDSVQAFEETEQHDGALGDLLGLIYSEVHRRGGIVKLHVSAIACWSFRTHNALANPAGQA